MTDDAKEDDARSDAAAGLWWNWRRRYRCAAAAENVMRSVGLAVGCVGVHGSASTWVFNVARELMIEALGAGQVAAGYTESVEGLPEAATGMVVKSHHGSVGLDRWLEEARAKIVVSVRDPRDAAISMSQRFGAGLDRTIKWVLNDSLRAVRMADRAAMVLRYEDRFFEDPATVARLARVLGLEVAPAAMARVFAQYRTEEVRRFASDLERLGAARVVTTSATRVDTVTQIHSTQIGDGRVGKWRDLGADERAEMERVFATVLAAFGYGQVD